VPAVVDQKPSVSFASSLSQTSKQVFIDSEVSIHINMGGVATAGGTYNAALERRQALMGASGARALVKNWKVFRIAAFACIGGVLYGYNQGMFSGILTMPAFGSRMNHPLLHICLHFANSAQIWVSISPIRPKKAG
jgi:hypothetical protein